MQIKKLGISIILTFLNSTNGIPLNEFGAQFKAIKSFIFGEPVKQSNSAYLPNYNKPVVKTTESKPQYIKSTTASITEKENSKTTNNVSNVSTSSNILLKPIESKLFNDINPLALLFLNDDMDKESLLPFMLLNNQSGNGINLNALLPFLISGNMDFSKLLPFLLMQNANNSNNLMMFLLMKNLLNKNSESGDLSDILLLSMLNNNKSSKSYIPINKPQLSVDFKPVLKPIVKETITANKTETINNETKTNKTEVTNSIQNILDDVEEQEKNLDSTTVVEEQKLSLDSILNAAIGMEVMAIIDPKEEGSGDDL